MWCLEVNYFELQNEKYIVCVRIYICEIHGFFYFLSIKDEERIQLFVKCIKNSCIVYFIIIFFPSQMYEKKKKNLIVNQYLLSIVKWKFGCDLVRYFSLDFWRVNNFFFFLLKVKNADARSSTKSIELLAFFLLHFAFLLQIEKEDFVAKEVWNFWFWNVFSIIFIARSGLGVLCFDI